MKMQPNPSKTGAHRQEHHSIASCYFGPTPCVSMEGKPLQLSLLERQQALPRADKSLAAVEQKRLNKQSKAILEILQQRPMTNDEMSKISRSHTRRISDIRQAGYMVELTVQDRSKGLNLYTLKSSPEPEQ